MARSMIAVALMLSCLLGCATTQTALQSKESGTVVVYDVSEAQAWGIAKRVFRWEGADAIEEDRPNHVMVTSSGMNAVSNGAVMACWIEPATDGGTKVTVVTKRRNQLNLFTTLTESKFHERFAQAVDIVHSGKPLPVERPSS